MKPRLILSFCFIIFFFQIITLCKSEAQEMVVASGAKITDPTNTGAASLSIPIEVPPGRNGIAPNLALNYNSNRGNGWIGVGWELSLGEIQRSTKYGVNYSANDFIFIANGASSELVPRVDWGSNYYGAKIEGAFSKFYFNSSTGGWEVTTKDGTKYFYGTDSNSFYKSRQDNQYGTFKWMLDKVQDINGNYMTITYWKDQGEVYLDRIDYTGNVSGLSTTNYVKFYYEGRTDAPPMYTSNALVKTAYRLMTIDVVANGSRVRAYKLTYTISGSTGRSLLASVQQYGSDAILDVNGTVIGGSSLLPSSSLSYTADSEIFNIGYSTGSICSPTDLNGVGDFNGDGKQDIWCRNGENRLFVSLSTGTSFAPMQQWAADSVCTSGQPMSTGDFDGDGKTDVLCINNEYRAFVHHSTGSSFQLENWLNGWVCSPTDLNGVGDFNGDGKQDIWCINAVYYLYAGLSGEQNKINDFLAVLSNNIGGTSTIAYQPSSAYTNTLLPFIVQTVSSITVNDGNGNLSTTNYTYSGGLFDYVDREFRGFEYVKATLPNGMTTEIWFKQDDIFKGLPYKQITRDSSLNIYTKSENIYDSVSPYAGVDFPYLIQKDDYVFDGTTTDENAIAYAKQARTEFWYDGYGNITRKYLYGDVLVIGDERDEYTEYNYDTINWLVSLPSTTYVKDNGIIKAQEWYTYTPDNKGNLWKKESWLRVEQTR